VLHVSRISVGAILAVVLWGGIRLVVVTHFQLSPALQIPMSVPYLSVPVGAAIMVIHLLASFFEDRVDAGPPRPAAVEVTAG
jgi:TRAP-type C4-dicarboxylate transport system permease small subunit